MRSGRRPMPGRSRREMSPQPSAHRPAPVVPVAARQSAFRGEAPAHGGVRAYGEMLSSLASAPPVPYGRRQVEMPAVRQHSIDIMPEDAQPVQAAHEAPVSSALPEESAPEQTALPGAQQTGEPLRVVGEVFRTYIVAERGSTLCLIDKHAAHERAIYEKLVAGLDETTPGQMLLASVTVRLCRGEGGAVTECRASWPQRPGGGGFRRHQRCGAHHSRRCGGGKCRRPCSRACGRPLRQTRARRAVKKHSG